MIDASAQKPKILGTGTSDDCNASRTWYSLSIRWLVLLKRLPGGFLRRTYCCPAWDRSKYVGFDCPLLNWQVKNGQRFDV